MLVLHPKPFSFVLVLYIEVYVMGLSHLPVIMLELPLRCETRKAPGKTQYDLLERFDGDLETAKDEHKTNADVWCSEERVVRTQYSRQGSP